MPRDKKLQKVLKYAREEGLAIDHASEDPLHDLVGQLTMKDIDDNFTLSHIPSDDELFPLEKLDVSTKSLKLLASIQRPPPFERVSSPDPHCTERQKMELPLLKTDHEVDMLSFAQRLAPDWENEILPLEHIDIEAGDGLELSSLERDLSLDAIAKIENDKITISKKALVYFSNAIRPPSRDEIIRLIEKMEAPSVRNLVPEPTTPLMLPRSPTITPHEPLLCRKQLGISSEQTSCISQEAGQLDNNPIQKLRLDSIETNTIGQSVCAAEESDRCIPDNPQPRTPCSVEHLRSIEDLQFKVPLTPPTTGQVPSIEASVSFKNSLAKTKPGLPPSVSRSPKDGTLLENQEGLSEDTFCPVTKRVEKGIEQDGFSDKDAALRVKAPATDLSQPNHTSPAHSDGIDDTSQYPLHCPGNTIVPMKCNCAENLLISETKQSCQIDLKTGLFQYGPEWYPSGFEQSLPWVSISTNLALVTDCEQISKDEALYHGFKCPSWQRSSVYQQDKRLKVLEYNKSDDKCIDIADGVETASLGALAKKRKQEFDEVLTKSLGHTYGSPQRGETLRGFDKYTRRPLDTVFETFDEFLRIRGEQTRCLKRIKQQHSTEVHIPPDFSRSPVSSIRSEQQLRHHISSAIRPKIQNVEAYTVIASSRFINQRSLMRHIKRIIPKLAVIARDYGHFEVETEARVTELNRIQEADLIISPAVGLIITSIQKLHQAPLPGQEPSHSNIRVHILSAAARYSTLIVLISQNQHPKAPPTELSASDNSSLRSFNAFTQSKLFTALEVDIQVLFVPGGDEIMAHWVASLISKYKVNQETISILQEETSWEVWLRAAGFNAFAAQALLAQLRPPKNGHRSLAQGPVLLLGMGAQERVNRFARIVGSEVLLERVSQVIDTRWNHQNKEIKTTRG